MDAYQGFCNKEPIATVAAEENRAFQYPCPKSAPSCRNLALPGLKAPALCPKCQHALENPAPALRVFPARRACRLFLSRIGGPIFLGSQKRFRTAHDLDASRIHCDDMHHSGLHKQGGVACH